MTTDRVVLLNAATQAIVADLPVGPGPVDLAFTPDGLLLLVANAGDGTTGGNTVTVISIPSLSVAASILVGSGPSRIGIRPGGGFAYVLNRLESVPANRVSVINLSTLTVSTTLTVGGGPHSIAFSTDGTRAIVTSVHPGGIHVIDTVAQAVTANLSTLPTPAGVVFRPGSHDALVANAELGPGCALVNTDLLTGVHGQGALAARSFMVIHPDGSRVYSLSSERGSLAVLNPVDGSNLTWGLLSTGGEADIAPDMDFQVLDIAAPAAGSASVIAADPGHALLRWDTSTDELVGSLHVGGRIKALDTSPDGLRVALSVDDSVVIADVGGIPVLAGPIEFPDPPPPAPQGPCPPITPGTCSNDVLVLEDDGLSNPATSLVVDTGSLGGERIYEGLSQSAIARFYEIMPDIFDYVVVFYSQAFREMQDPVDGLPINVQPTGLRDNALHSWTRNFTRGIGFTYMPANRFGNQADPAFDPPLIPPLTTRRLQSRLDMNDLAEYDENFIAFGGRSGVSIFAQELGHRFVAFADTVAPGVRPRRLLREGLPGHWGSTFNSFGSAVGGVTGNLLTPIAPFGTTARVDAQEITYGPWDEYLMGFVPPASVPDSFFIRFPNPPIPPFPQAYPVGQIITGVLGPQTISALILQEGARRPSDKVAQRVFHVGTCLVVPKDQPICPEHVAKARAFVDLIANFWRTETEDRAFLTSRMCPTIYTQPETSIGVSGYPVDAAILPNGKKLYVAMNEHEDSVVVIDTDPDSPTFHHVLSNIHLLEGDATAVEVSPDGLWVYVTTPPALYAGCPASSVKVITTGTDVVIDTVYTSCLPLPATGAQAIAVARAGVPSGLNRGYVLMTTPPRIAVFDMNGGYPTPLPGINFGVDAPSTVTPDIEITTDGIAIVFTRPGEGKVTARYTGTNFVQQFDLELGGGLVPTGVAIVQLESNADNTLDRATVPPTVVAPASLVYVTTQTGITRVFDLRTDPVLGILSFRRMSIDPDSGAAPFRPDILGTGAPGALEVEFSRQGNLAVVGQMFGDTVQLINTSTHSLDQTITLSIDPPHAYDADPAAFVFSPDGQRLYVMSKNARRVDVFK